MRALRLRQDFRVFAHVDIVQHFQGKHCILHYARILRTFSRLQRGAQPPAFVAHAEYEREPEHVRQKENLVARKVARLARALQIGAERRFVESIAPCGAKAHCKLKDIGNRRFILLLHGDKTISCKRIRRTAVFAQYDIVVVEQPFERACNRQFPARGTIAHPRMEPGDFMKRGPGKLQQLSRADLPPVWHRGVFQPLLSRSLPLCNFQTVVFRHNSTPVVYGQNTAAPLRKNAAMSPVSYQCYFERFGKKNTGRLCRRAKMWRSVTFSGP